MATEINLTKFADLKRYADKVGVDVRVGDTREAVIEKLLAVDPDLTHIPEADEVSGEVVQVKIKAADGSDLPTDADEGPIDGHHRNDPKVVLMIPPTKEQGGNRDVFVGVNGTGFLIMRNKQVEVPYRVYEALENAVETTYIFQDAGPGEKPEMIPVEGYAYPFMLRKMPPIEEVEAWRKRIADTFAP